MKTVTVDASKAYDVLIGENLLLEAGKIVKERFGLFRVCIITDDIVDGHYGEKCVRSFVDAGFSVEKIVIKNGEESKNCENLINIVNTLAQMQFTRNDVLIALGGGVVGDLCGFCAATYMRGIRFIQIPTTLLAAVDSSVGGKTAVDLPAGKNLFGAFWQPSIVICDTKTLDTLSDEIYSCGMAEVIKYAFIKDAELLERLEKDSISREEMIERCVCIKRDIVAEDEFETGLRQILNFGHTIGHAVEALSNFELSHGQCVAIGMKIVTKGISAPEKTVERLENILNKFSLSTKCDFDTESLLDKISRDKKRVSDGVNVICVKEIGEAQILKLDFDSIRRLIDLGVK
ncbi:MAG: 3-dehydroquinate synthase [Clostridia bacterium]|nr:3-dehydroquinate synthase [Clostridia bacterium]